MKNAFSCMVFALLLAGCKKDSKQPADTDDKKALIGQWNWVLQFDDGFYSGNATSDPAADNLTPANTGIHQTLTFRENNTWALQQDNQTIQAGFFKYIALPTPGGLITSLDLIKNGTDSFVNHAVYNDTLYIASQLVVGVHTGRLYVKSTGTSNQ